jgi:acyl-CoA hydrolase
MNRRAAYYSDVETCVEETLRRMGKHIVLGAPLGLGKGNNLINEFYRRAVEDPSIDLQIFTALTLARPHWNGELERRFLQPLTERLFSGYPELEYFEPLKKGTLPNNIRVTEFYFQPGSLLDSTLAQRYYMSSNYTHVVRDVLDAGINVLAQLVSKTEQDGKPRYSLSCNSDLTLDVVPRARDKERRGAKFALLAEVNDNLPFMYGDADVGPEYFDGIVENSKYAFPLFGPPNSPVSTAEYMIGLHVSSLIRDGGTLQVGIGALEDAISYLLKLRHQRNDVYREILTEAGISHRYGGAIEALGGDRPFEQGLYASSEMLVDGFLELYRCGILRRKVYQHTGLQRLLNEDSISEAVSRETLSTLVENEIISSSLSSRDFGFLQRFGIFKPELCYEDHQILTADGGVIPGDLGDEDVLRRITSSCLGSVLKGGHYAHTCFFLGPRSFYDSLRRMSALEREEFCMTGISYVNELFGDEELKRLQRNDARFVNTGLIATLTGAIASDGLEDGRVISGVGGQYNFVAMAHELDGGRSIMMIRSTKEEDGRLHSNIRWNYGHVTIPRHLRDIVITEYGIADLRGRNDEEVIKAMLEIADSRFQEQLVKQARAAGKIKESYRIPDYACNNNPKRIEKLLSRYRERGLFEEFPFGTDLTREEITLKKALEKLKDTIEGKEFQVPGLLEIVKTISVPDTAHVYLERMALDRPQSLKEKLLQRSLVYALASIGAI